MNKNFMIKFASAFCAFTMVLGNIHAQELEASVNPADDNNADINLRYDIQKQFGLTASVSTVYASELDTEYTDALTSVLAGKLAGLVTIADGGTAGGATLYVRGRSSSNHTDPIIYVDGLRSSIANITLAEIETISVLKDAAALSIFGQDGADGVIYITTKRGKIGKPSVNINFRQGFQQVTELPDFVDSYTFASLYNEALSNDNGAWTQFYTDEQLAAYKNGNDGTIENYDLLYPNVNWYDEVLRKFAPVTTADVTFSGGNKNLRYFASIGYQGVQGLYAGTDKKRDINSNVDDQKFNFRINIDANLGKIFDLKGGIAGTIRHQYRPNSDTNTLWTMMHTIPANAMPVMTPEGYGGNVLYQSNPVAEVLETGYYDNHNRVVDANFTLGQNLDFLLKGLRLEESIALNSTHQQVTSKSKKYQTFAPYLGTDGALMYNIYGTQDTDFSISNTGNGNNNMANRLQTEVSLKYRNTFGRHLVNVTATFHNDSYNTETNYPAIITRGFHGRLGYGYDERFFAEFDWSASGVSMYNPASNTGFFPALSLAYIFANDKSGQKAVNFLKLRASSGLTGYSDLSTAANYYMYQQYYNSSNNGNKFNWTGVGGKKGLYEYYAANPDAKWETIWRSNIGVDARFFQNRLSVSADAFYDYNNSILVAANIPGYFGLLSDKNVNEGKMFNAGCEVNVRWSDTVGDFSYSINPVLSFARNRVIDLNQAPQPYDYMSNVGISVGQPLLYVADGFYQSQEEVDVLPSMLSTVQPGDIRYKDLNGDGKIDTNDRTYDHGLYSTLPELTFGLNLQFAYKGIDLQINGYGAANRSVNTYNAQTRAFSNGQYNVSSLAAGRWAYYPEQGIDTRATATFPRLSLGSNENNTAASTFWYKSGSFFRISNISLGYSFPARLLSRARIDKVRIYAAVSNPFMFDGVYGDAETLAGWPPMRTYKVGFNFNF